MSAWPSRQRKQLLFSVGSGVFHAVSEEQMRGYPGHGSSCVSPCVLQVPARHLDYGFTLSVLCPWKQLFPSVGTAKRQWHKWLRREGDLFLGRQSLGKLCEETWSSLSVNWMSECSFVQSIWKLAGRVLENISLRCVNLFMLWNFF